MNPDYKTIESSSHAQTPDVTETIGEIARGINLGETVVFCGAGISFNSGLPVVNQIIPYVLLTLCASRKEIHSIEENLKIIQNPINRINKLIEIIRDKMEVSEEALNKIMDVLPFEAFIETLHVHSTINKIFDIYDADTYAPVVEPNTNHIFLAKLVALNKLKTIVTTNFDQLIEKALKMEGKIEGKDYDVLYKEEYFENIDWSKDHPRLIKIHGSIHDKDAMAITLSHVAKKELSEARAKIVDHVYSHGRHKQVLIFGYSCSDIFDLSPQIETIKENQKKVFLIQHSDSQKAEKIWIQKNKNPFKKFEDGTRLFFNTNQLIAALWSSFIHGTDSSKKSDANWKEKVDQWYSESIQQLTEAFKYVILGSLFHRIAEWSTAIRYYEHGLIVSKKYNMKQYEGVIIGYLGNAHRSLGDYRKAIKYHEQALTIARAIGDKHVEGTSLGNLGNVHRSLGEYPKAIEYYEQALTIARTIGDKWSEEAVLANLGATYSLGDYRKAIKYHEQALNIGRAIGDKYGEGLSLAHLGDAYNKLGEYPRAIEYYEQALNISRAIGDKAGEGYRLNSLGITYGCLGKYSKTIEYCEQALNIARAIGDKHGEGEPLANLGTSYCSLGEYPKGIEYYEQALNIARTIEDKKNEGAILGNLGNVYLSLEKCSKAIECYEQALNIARAIGDKKNEGLWFGGLGNAYCSLEEYPKAIEFLNQSLDVLHNLLPSNHPYIKAFENNLRVAKSNM